MSGQKKLRVMGTSMSSSTPSILTLVDLVRYAAAHEINLNFSNLFNSPGTEMEKGYINKISDMPDSEMASLWEIANSIPRRMKVENRKTDIILTGPFFNIIKNRATVQHQDYIKPRDDEILYLDFIKSLAPMFKYVGTRIWPSSYWSSMYFK